MLGRSEQHVKRRVVVRQVFCTKHIKKYIVDLEIASSTSLCTIGICQTHVAGIALVGYRNWRQWWCKKEGNKVFGKGK